MTLTQAATLRRLKKKSSSQRQLNTTPPRLRHSAGGTLTNNDDAFTSTLNPGGAATGGSDEKNKDKGRKTKSTYMNKSTVPMLYLYMHMPLFTDCDTFNVYMQLMFHVSFSLPNSNALFLPPT